MTSPTRIPIKTTAAKAWVAAIGGTLTALTTAVAAVSVALDDDAIDLGEVGAIVTAAVTLVGTVYGVWAVINKPISAGQSDVKPNG